jgi:hypothetical protein
MSVAFTGWMVIEHRRTRVNDKFPCLVVRSRLNMDTRENEARLVNVGRGPALITKLVTGGLDKLQGFHEYKDGDHTHEIDRIIGPEIGNPDLQCWFAYGSPADLRKKTVSIGIEYKDMGGRIFRSGIIHGIPVWETPPEFTFTTICLWLHEKFCKGQGNIKHVSDLQIFLNSFDQNSSEQKSAEYPSWQG